jgi:hypothetical protein
MTERIVFVGEDGGGRQTMIEWYPADDAEVVLVSTRRSSFARWSRPVECAKTDDWLISVTPPAG